VFVTFQQFYGIDVSKDRFDITIFIKSFIGSTTLRKTKNDKKDATSIALLLESENHFRDCKIKN